MSIRVTDMSLLEGIGKRKGEHSRERVGPLIEERDSAALLPSSFIESLRDVSKESFPGHLLTFD